MEDQIAKLETDLKELNNRNDEIEYELEKTRDKAFKLDRQLADTLIKQKQMVPIQSTNNTAEQSNGHSKTNQQNNRNDSKQTNPNDKQVIQILFTQLITQSFKLITK